MSDQTVESFSLSHAAILDGTTGAEAADIFGVRQGNLELATDNFDNTGDDTILSIWQWFTDATLSVTSGFIPFPTLELITGSVATHSGSGANDFHSLPLWEERQINTKPRPVLVRMPAKDKDGEVRYLDFVLFKVQFGPFSFDGPAYKEGLSMSYNGRALMSSKDEKGQPYLDSKTGNPSKAIGRMLSRPFDSV